MRLSYKYRLYPNVTQTAKLEYHLREACDLYNCALEERRGAWNTCRKSISFYDQVYQLKHMRAEGLIGIANFSACAEVLRRLDRSFQSFFARVRRGDRPGYPRFKSVRRYDSFTFPEYGKGCKIRDRALYIQGVGEIKIKLHRPVEGAIKTSTIKRDAGRWFVVFSVECEPKPIRYYLEPEVGIDVGLSSFATLSDGSEIDNPRYRQVSEHRLRIAHRRLSRRSNKQSNRRRKAAHLLQRQHSRIRNQRNNFHHEVSKALVYTYGLIAVEDLNIKGLASGMLAKSVNDAGWGSFLNKLAYKAESAGREFVKVDPCGTSQTCVCGASVPKMLKDRWHFCTECGLSACRDHVSAQVILGRGLRLRNKTWPVGASVLREAVTTACH